MPPLEARDAQTVVQFTVEGGMGRGDHRLDSFEGHPNPGRARQRAGVYHDGHRSRGFQPLPNRPIHDPGGASDHDDVNATGRPVAVIARPGAAVFGAVFVNGEEFVVVANFEAGRVYHLGILQFWPLRPVVR